MLNKRRCRMHGGASLSGSKHPRYKDGLYSKYTPQGRKRLANLERRRKARERVRQVQTMSSQELRAEARRILGPVPLKLIGLTLEDWRRILLDQARARLQNLKKEKAFSLLN